VNRPELDVDIDPSQLRMAGAVATVGVLLLALAAVAWVIWGPLAGGLFVVAAVLGVSGPPLAILMIREGVPNLAGVGLVIAAQIAFGQAALVRREDGRYEWTVLRGSSGDYRAELEDGTTVPIDADRGELFSFGLGKLAVVEQKGRNVDEFTTTHTPGDSDTRVDERAGIDIRPPRREDGGILVTLASIQRRVRGSASSDLVRRGRDKALDEEGGEGQLSQLWTMGFATVLLIVGFAMTAGVMLL